MVLFSATACDRSAREPSAPPTAGSSPSAAQTTDGGSSPGTRIPGPEDLKVDGPLPDAFVPTRAGEFTPSLARLAEATPNHEVLNERDSCAACHPTIVSEWGESVHRFSSMNNPFYVVAFDAFVKESGSEKARFCNGCHEPTFQFRAEPKQIEPTDPNAYVGIGCGTCHGAVEVTSDGNASYTLTTTPVPLPKEGDPDSLAAHRARVGADALRSDALCVSCHRAFLSPDTGHDVFVAGADEFGPWRRSGYTGSKATRIDDPVTPSSCTGCHMPRAEGAPSTTLAGESHASHRFPGGHTTLAHAVGAEGQVEAIEETLRDVAVLDIVPMAPRGGFMAPVGDPAAQAISPSAPVVFDVLVFNKGVGHSFPGGVKDLRDTWVEVVVEDAAGEVVARSGVDHAESGSEKGVFRLRALLIGDDSDAVFEHAVARFRTAVFDRTVGPRDVGIARYTWTPPEALGAARLPLTVRARLRHRRLQRAIHDRACANTKTPRGGAFIQGTAKHNGARVDPCRPQPILDLAAATLQLGEGAEAPASTVWAAWERQLRHGQGLTHHVQERLEEALTSLKAAEALLPKDAPDWGRAAVLLEQARVLGRQGRTQDAMEMLGRVDAIVPDHPATAKVRAEAHAQVWRWEEAAAAWTSVTRNAPRDDRGWRGLAIALGSLGRRGESLRAAQRGLALEPRDAHLLRSQSIALSRLAPDSEDAKAAQEAWLAYRRDEASSMIKGKCQDPDSDCQFERIPIPERPLRSPDEPPRAPASAPASAPTSAPR